MRSPWTFAETIEYLENLSREPIVPATETGLRRVELMLEALGHPERSFRSIHVAGSCGKGSTTTMIGAILHSAGIRTGLFRSPHLECYRERISLNRTDISESDWCACFARVQPIAERMRANAIPGYSFGRPSFSEILFAMACLYFQETGAEWAAVETGLGGRLDATNTLRPDVVAITNVSLEHTQILGETVEAIAREKAAIIKAGAHVVTAAHRPEALAVIEERVGEVGTELLRIPPDVQVRIQHQDLYAQRVELDAGEKIDVSLPLAGRFQALNAAVATGCMIALRRRGMNLPTRAIVQGLEGVKLPGRFEVVSADPLVVLDGAHNPTEAEELRRTLDDLLPGRPINLLFASMSDKDVEAMARALGQRAHRVVVTRNPGTDRAAPLEVLASHFERLAPSVSAIEDPCTALGEALSSSNGAAVVICGSLYLVGALRASLVREAAGV